MPLDDGADLVGAGVDGGPGRVVVAGCRPAGEFLAGVVGFAHQEVGFEDGAGAGFPVGAGGDVGGGAVLVFEVELKAGAGLFAVMVALAGEADVAGVPAVAQDGAQGVLAGLDSGLSRRRRGRGRVSRSRSSRG